MFAGRQARVSFFSGIGRRVVKEWVKELIVKGRISGSRVIEGVGIGGRGEEIRQQELGDQVKGEEFVGEFVEEVKIGDVIRVKVKIKVEKVVRALV